MQIVKKDSFYVFYSNQYVRYVFLNSSLCFQFLRRFAQFFFIKNEMVQYLFFIDMNIFFIHIEKIINIFTNSWKLSRQTWDLEKLNKNRFGMNHVLDLFINYTWLLFE